MLIIVFRKCFKNSPMDMKFPPPHRAFESAIGYDKPNIVSFHINKLMKIFIKFVVTHHKRKGTYLYSI